jgi:hypothetical protein
MYRLSSNSVFKSDRPLDLLIEVIGPAVAPRRESRDFFDLRRSSLPLIRELAAMASAILLLRADERIVSLALKNGTHRVEATKQEARPIEKAKNR